MYDTLRLATNKGVHLVLEGLPEGVAGRGLQLVAVRLVDDLNHLVFGFLDGGDDVGVGAGISNGVADTDAVALQQKPVVDHRLNVSVEFAVFLEKK
jgi:hypothetical protein